MSLHNKMASQPKDVTKSSPGLGCRSMVESVPNIGMILGSTWQNTGTDVSARARARAQRKIA